MALLLLSLSVVDLLLTAARWNKCSTHVGHQLVSLPSFLTTCLLVQTLTFFIHLLIHLYINLSVHLLMCHFVCHYALHPLPSLYHSAITPLALFPQSDPSDLHPSLQVCDLCCDALRWIPESTCLTFNKQNSFYKASCVSTSAKSLLVCLLRQGFSGSGIHLFAVL